MLYSFLSFPLEPLSFCYIYFFVAFIYKFFLLFSLFFQCFCYVVILMEKVVNFSVFVSINIFLSAGFFVIFSVQAFFKQQFMYPWVYLSINTFLSFLWQKYEEKNNATQIFDEGFIMVFIPLAICEQEKPLKKQECKRNVMFAKKCCILLGFQSLILTVWLGYK